MNWRNFTPSDIEYDFEADKLSEHNLTYEEAIETFFNTFEARRNKSFKDRYVLIGQTNGGRKLKIIFQLKPNKIVRIITGWDI